MIAQLKPRWVHIRPSRKNSAVRRIDPATGKYLDPRPAPPSKPITIAFAEAGASAPTAAEMQKRRDAEGKPTRVVRAARAVLAPIVDLARASFRFAAKITTRTRHRRPYGVPPFGAMLPFGSIMGPPATRLLPLGSAGI